MLHNSHIVHKDNRMRLKFISTDQPISNNYYFLYIIFLEVVVHRSPHVVGSASLFFAATGLEMQFNRRQLVH